MHPLNAEWLIAKIERSAHDPRQRLLNAFDILSRHAELAEYQKPSTSNSIATIPQDVAAYLTRQARAAGINAPEILAQQLYFMLVQALSAEQNQPGCKAVQHAKTAAAAIIDAQMTPARRQKKTVLYGIAASLFSIIGVGSILVQANTTSTEAAVASITQQAVIPSTETAFLATSGTANPARTAALYASIEHMREGVCDYPQALVLPPEQQGIYIDNIVRGQVSTKFNEQQVMDRLMSQVSCNYAPMLMKNSAG